MSVTSKQLLALEKQTLDRIATLKPFEAFAGLRSEALKLRRLVDPDRGGLDFHAIFHLHVMEQKPSRKVDAARRFDLGGLIVVETPSRLIQRSCYQLVIGKGKDQTKPVLRKIHFDFEPIAFRNASEPKPSRHIQFGGEVLPQWAGGKGYGLDKLHHLYPWLEKPRIPAFPTSLALMLDWIFLEFSHNRFAKAVLDNSDWNAHVREAEATLIEPFLKDCYEFIRNAKVTKKCWLRQQVYEMTV